MSYSDDTINYMAWGFDEVAILDHKRRNLCEVCLRHEATDMVHFPDGMTFKVCVSCRPFDPRLCNVKVIPNTPLNPN